MTKKDINKLIESKSYIQPSLTGENISITEDMIRKSLDEALKDPQTLQNFNAKMDEIILRAIKSLVQESNVMVEEDAPQLKAASKKR
jgi:hypothetical protein